MARIMNKCEYALTMMGYGVDASPKRGGSGGVQEKARPNPSLARLGERLFYVSRRYSIMVWI